MENFSLPISAELTKTLFLISLTLLVAIIADNVLRSFIRVPKSLENRRSRTYVIILRKVVTVIVYVSAVFLISGQIGVNLTPLLASASIIGIVVGIGARTVIEDIINGFFILTQESIAIGDYIKIDDAEGVIDKLGFRSLSLRGDGGELYIIPNGLVKKVVNFSGGRAKTFLDFPIKADQDIDLTFKALHDALSELKKNKEFLDVVFEGTGVLGITEYKVDGRIIIRVKIITTPGNRFKAARKYRYLAKKQFEKHKIALC